MSWWPDWDKWGPSDWTDPSARSSSWRPQSDPSAHRSLCVHQAHPSEEQYQEMISYGAEQDQDLAHYPNRLKILRKGMRHQENKCMAQEDRLSAAMGALQRKEEEKIVEKAVVEEKIVHVGQPSSGRPEPQFAAGQSVHQWWASWMAGATAHPAGLNEKRDGLLGSRRRCWCPRRG